MHLHTAKRNLVQMLVTMTQQLILYPSSLLAECPIFVSEILAVLVATNSYSCGEQTLVPEYDLARQDIDESAR